MFPLALLSTAALVAALGIAIYFTVVFNKYKTTLKNINNNLSGTQDYVRATKIINPYGRV